MRAFFLIAILLAFSSCSGAKVRARTLYVGRDSLASHIKDTPDPEKQNSGPYQVVWIQWRAPENVKDQGANLILDVTLRFTNGSERHEQIPLQGYFGNVSVHSSADEQKETGPILSYRIVLKSGNNIVASTKHKLWVEKITITDL